MDYKTEHPPTIHRRSAASRRKLRRCVPILGQLEVRGLLSAVAAPVIHAPTANLGPHVAEIAAADAQLARHEALIATRDAHAATAVHFPGGSVHVNRHGTHVTFPGGSVRAGRLGVIVEFPGGYVISRLGHTIVKFPGGFINI
jgi:hypothetical protein